MRIRETTGLTVPQPAMPAVIERRPPSLPRRRRLLQGSLSVLLIVGFGLAFVVVLANTRDRVRAVAVTDTVPAGQPLSGVGMRAVELPPDTGLDLVPWTDRDQVSRLYAAVDIAPGSLLVGSMLTDSPDALEGKVLVGLFLRPGHYPPQLAVGDTVNAVHSGGGAAPVDPVLVTGAIVHTVREDDRPGGELSVAVLVDQAESVALAQAAASGDVVLTITPG